MPRGRKAETTQIDQTEPPVQIEQTERAPVYKTKGTAPGWRPAGQLPKLKGPEGFTVKWASSEPAKLSKLRAEGWEIMRPTDNKGDAIVQGDVNDAGSMTGELRFRDLVAVMLPNELKQARDEWVRQENADAMKSILDKTDEEFKANGVETYKPTGHQGRVVIE